MLYISKWEEEILDPVSSIRYMFKYDFFFFFLNEAELVQVHASAVHLMSELQNRQLCGSIAKYMMY